MIAALDSAFAPSAASLIAAKAAGVRLWAGYFAGPNLYHGWSQNDFSRVKATGLATLAFCSGWSDPAAMRAQALAWGVPICLDVEGGIRGNGAWVQGWLNTSGAGLYGNAPVFSGHRATFYILAAYPGFNPQRTWSGTPPGRPCGWQYQGTHSAFGATVDSSWYDDEIATLRFTGNSNSLGGDDDMQADEREMLINTNARVLGILQLLQGVPDAQGNLSHPTPLERLLAASADADPTLRTKIDALSKHLGVGTA